MLVFQTDFILNAEKPVKQATLLLSDTISYSSQCICHRYAWTRQVYLSHEISQVARGIVPVAWVILMERLTH